MNKIILTNAVNDGTFSINLNVVPAAEDIMWSVFCHDTPQTMTKEGGVVALHEKFDSAYYHSYKSLYDTNTPDVTPATTWSGVFYCGGFAVHSTSSGSGTGDAAWFADNRYPPNLTNWWDVSNVTNWTPRTYVHQSTTLSNTFTLTTSNVFFYVPSEADLKIRDFNFEADAEPGADSTAPVVIITRPTNGTVYAVLTAIRLM